MPKRPLQQRCLPHANMWGLYLLPSREVWHVGGSTVLGVLFWAAGRGKKQPHALRACQGTPPALSAQEVTALLGLLGRQEVTPCSGLLGNGTIEYT